MKGTRQSKILDIIGKQQIETQEDLILKLREEGYDVTQATVSRDIRELKLIKTLTDNGSYRYSVPSSDAHQSQHIYSTALANSLKSVEYAQNIIVVKTYPGIGQAVGAAIDSLQEPNLLGSVAGDDTVIIIARSTDFAVDFATRIRENAKA